MCICFAFDISILNKDNEERTFEMAKAEKYLIAFPTILAYNLDENICPEMHKAMLQAKQKFAYMWPDEHNDYTISDLLFRLHALSSRNKKLEYALLEAQQEIAALKLNVAASSDPSKYLDNKSGFIYTEETMSCNPVPGMMTILSCAEKQITIATPPTTLTVDLRTRVDAIQQMFGNYTTTCVDQTTMVTDTTEMKPKPSSPKILSPSYSPSGEGHLRISNDTHLPYKVLSGVGTISTLSDGRGVAHDQFHREPVVPKSSIESIQETKTNPKGLQIYRDPECINQPPTISRHGLRTVEEISQTRKKEKEIKQTCEFKNESMFNPLCASTALFPRHNLSTKPVQAFSANEIIEFNPPLASTAVFPRSSNVPKTTENAAIIANSPCASTTMFPHHGLVIKPTLTSMDNEPTDFNPPLTSTTVFSRPLSLPKRDQDPEIAFNTPLASMHIFQQPSVTPKPSHYNEEIKLNQAVPPHPRIIKRSPLRPLDIVSSCEMEFSPPKPASIMSNSILEAFRTVPSPCANEALRPNHTEFLEFFLKGQKKNPSFDVLEEKPPV